MHRLFYLFLFCAAGSYAQSGPVDGLQVGGATRLSGQDSAMRMFEQAVALMQRNPFKKSVDWDAMVSQGRDKLSEATTCQDAYPVINECLQQAQNNHSFVMSSQRTALYHNDSAQLKRKPALRELMGPLQGEMVEGGIGYITVPWINTTDPALCAQVADSIQAIIGQLAASGATRWIIDLRKNNGGNCWPMLAGVGPLLGDGVCGYFVREARVTPFRYEAGTVYNGKSVTCRTNKPVVIAQQQRQQIVVLTGAGTVSAGELLAMSFRGMSNARLMGEPTSGYTTANTTYGLMDGSTLVLTVCREADRTGKVYEGKIYPDDLVKQDPLHKNDDVVKATAVMWLQSQ